MRMSEIPPDVLQALNEGREETITLVEWLAIDMPTLLRSVLPRVGLAEMAEELGRVADSLAGEGVTKRLKAISEALFLTTKDHPQRSEVFEALASQPSDMVRAWAAFMLTADDSLPLADRLEAARRFAADGSVAVRECAWDSFRPYLAADLGFAFQLLGPWVRDPDPNIRRCAIESTRPRGVWTSHLDALKADPEPGLILLEPVRSDPSRYVQNALANWLNDASKSRPDWAQAVCDRWAEESPTRETAWIVNRALRTLRKEQHLDTARAKSRLYAANKPDTGGTPMAQIGRLLTAMVTPFDEEGKVDYQQARRLAQALLDSGSEGVIVSGTTGESPVLSRDEKLRLFGEVKEAIGARGSVIAGTGSYNTAESIELSQEAERLGVDGLLLVVPYYNRPPQEGLYQHFKTIATSTHLPSILYNVPSRTSTNMTAETTLRLGQVDTIVGVKEASGDLAQIGSIIANAPNGFLVWSGNDSDTFLIMSMGGYGVVSVVSHLVGRQIQQMMGLLLEGTIERAAEEHHRLMPIFKGLFWVSNPIPVKYALNRVGFPVGKPRLPLVEPDESTASRLDALLKGYTIDLPVEVKA